MENIPTVQALHLSHSLHTLYILNIAKEAWHANASNMTKRQIMHSDQTDDGVSVFSSRLQTGKPLTDHMSSLRVYVVIIIIIIIIINNTNTC